MRECSLVVPAPGAASASGGAAGATAGAGVAVNHSALDSSAAAPSSMNPLPLAASTASTHKRHT